LGETRWREQHHPFLRFSRTEQCKHRGLLDGAVARSDPNNRLCRTELNGCVGRFRNIERWIADVVKPQKRCLIRLVKCQLSVVRVRHIGTESTRWVGNPRKQRSGANSQGAFVVRQRKPEADRVSNGDAHPGSRSRARSRP